ncbi:class I SAM-dependent methyltransferase [Streptomyces venezuelae]|uniref:SAM-dependent methyltransferase n=1 Tax=Streptomyces venezuelae TaxID=54571 RepID=A0A5P2BI47_STRVZ|nr:class I SAM-dependent methyltransferase [Streptomyces venezuelae]QES30056.1 SAM-dependent methyltransferase [Streptomyces venezuelae]
MPTIPESEPHRHRRMAESFGADAERYDRARPRYPTPLVRRIAATAPGPTVLDVGCGTGIVARQLRAAECEVLGVEPDERMAELARGLGTEVEPGTFEEWDPAGRTFDAVVAGQAWHWVDPVAGAAKAARVLRPGGLLAAFWNMHEPPPAVADAFADALHAVAPDVPFDVRAKPGPDPLLDTAADGIRATRAFGDPERWSYAWEWTYTRDAWLDQLPTQGALTRLPVRARSEVLAAVGAAVDTLGGSFTMRYTTVALTARAGGAP